MGDPTPTDADTALVDQLHQVLEALTGHPQANHETLDLARALLEHVGGRAAPTAGS